MLNAWWLGRVCDDKRSPAMRRPFQLFYILKPFYGGKGK